MDLEKFKGVCKERIQDAIDKAIKAAMYENGRAQVQFDKDNVATQSQINALFRIVWWLIGVIVVESLGFGLGMLYLVLMSVMK